jgi:C4-dicarboxylate-specific signal transduction histidine kinase
VIEDAATVVKGLSASMAKEATIRVETQELRLHTDSTILKRVVINMLKNALEASNGEETICAGCHHRGDRAVVWVRNRGVIPEAVQFQLFQRFFSTKGKGRGIGTYSMKLLTERYLGGEVAFSSDTQKGTEFRALLPL